MADTTESAEQMSIANFCMIGIGGVPPRLVMANPPARTNRWTPEEALVVAAWLVAIAEPMTDVKFSDILERVQNT